jgi:hypothetical protein
MAFVFMMQEQSERMHRGPNLPPALKYGTRLVYAIVSGSDSSADQINLSLLFGSLFIVELLACAFLIVASFKISGIWRWVAGMMAVTYLATALTYFATAILLRPAYDLNSLMSVVSAFFSVAVLILGVLNIILVIAAMIIDRRNRISRDWLHWIALIVFFFHSVAQPIIDQLFTYYANLNP